MPPGGTAGRPCGSAAAAPTGDLAAGDFSVWLARMRAALQGGAGTDVPCGGCCACCSASYFVHVAPDERDTLAVVPPELLFPAPVRPPGHLVLPYDERGRCPMLAADGRCSIHEHRPRTCRVYDCRVFAAAGVDADRDAITARSHRWSFTYPARSDRDEQRAVREAARFVREHGAALPGGPPVAADLAVLAVQVGDLFLGERYDADDVDRLLAGVALAMSQAGW